MKDLTKQQFKDIPSDVMYVYMCSTHKIPIGSSVYERIIKENPEYFPEEIEYRRKWDLIPDEVHDAYWEEYSKIEEEFFKDVPQGKGIIHMIENPEESAEWDRLYKEANDKREPLIAELRKKYYSKYGIE